MSIATVHRSHRAPSTILGRLAVHKESVTLAVLPTDAFAPVRVDTLDPIPSSSRSLFLRIKLEPQRFGTELHGAQQQDSSSKPPQAP